MATLTFRGDTQVALCEGPGRAVMVPYDEGGEMWLYVNDSGSLVVGDSPPQEVVHPSAPPAASEAKPKRSRKK